VQIAAPRLATREELLRFHEAPHVQWVELRSRIGSGIIDDEDTPAYPGVYEAHATRVGCALDALARIMEGSARRAFQPVGGLHHARRHRGAGFCVFSDIGVVIETLRSHHGVRRIAYIDIDAHHGDGVFDSYEADPDLIFAGIHEDGRFSIQARAMRATPAKAPRRGPRSTFHWRRARAITNSLSRGRRSRRISCAISRSSSSCKRALTASPAIRWPICVSRRTRTRMPRAASSHWPSNLRMGA
jgi:hypothetical protein